jgi:hypothetical protein
LESYQYLGLDTIVSMDHPETDIDLTYISTHDETGSAGDQYVGLDQFGRVVDQNWYDTATDSSVANIAYGYDNDGNVLYADNLVNSTMSELYTYDDLGQLTSFERGTLSDDNTEIASPSESETWTYDSMGNHEVDSTTVGETTTNIYSTFNYENQITDMTGAASIAYDSDGNMVTDQSGLQYVYNAWSQVVNVENSEDTVLETYTYDGLGDHVTNTVYSGETSTTTSFYYSTAGQVLEEQANATSYYTQRYVWSPAYVNEMIARDTSTSGSLTPTGSSFTRTWSIFDANYNVVAIVQVSDSVASVVERYAYDPFGTQTVMSAAWVVSEDGSSYDWVYGFQGMRVDGVTGDSILISQLYSPQTSRCLSNSWLSNSFDGVGALPNQELRISFLDQISRRVIIKRILDMVKKLRNECIFLAVDIEERAIFINQLNKIIPALKKLNCNSLKNLINYLEQLRYSVIFQTLQDLLMLRKLHIALGKEFNQLIKLIDPKLVIDLGFGLPPIVIDLSEFPPYEDYIDLIMQYYLVIRFQNLGLTEAQANALIIPFFNEMSKWSRFFIDVNLWLGSFNRNPINALLDFEDDFWDVLEFLFGKI